MELEAEVPHVQIVFHPPILGELLDVDLVVEVARLELILLPQHLFPQPEILFRVEGALGVVIHLTLQMSAPNVVSDLSSSIHLSCIYKERLASRTFLLSFSIIMHVLE